MVQREAPPSVGQFAAILAAAFAVIAVGWWFLSPQPRHYRDLVSFAMVFAVGFVIFMQSRKK
jgi:hypothetical protein